MRPSPYPRRSAECGSHTLVDGETGDVIAHADHHGEYCGGDVLGYIGY
ncbi:hypothetical protein [Rhizobium sp. BK251]|nr:hypothetical protein [Rhizobium sp. BK251]TCL66357.1 hypothetical protein EV286_11168 [Rhizobium sp. BK251]